MAFTFHSLADDEATVVTDHLTTQTCPDDFFQLPLYPLANLCQIFAEELPASLVYHAKADQETTKAYYLQTLGQAESEDTLKGRIVLQYKNGDHIIIISEDGNGSQVDILVKAQDQV
ncbi:MAG: hypothetical protein ACI808_000664 [Paraglaciecola sp.]|jgi:hypothetical protein